MFKPIIGVIGIGDPCPEAEKVAEEVGAEIARRGAILINGGLGGVMEASARGAKKAGGMTVGILMGMDASEANPFIDIPILTGLGDVRNFLIVRSSDALIAVNGGYGTLSEIAVALKMSKPVVGIDTWKVSEEVMEAVSPLDAVNKIFSCLKKVF